MISRPDPKHRVNPAEAASEPLFCESGFVAGGSIRGRHGGWVAIEALPAILRTLLVTDGTVTKTLEAYYWEPVAVSLQTQSFTRLPNHCAWLARERGAGVLRRAVQLRGKRSGRLYVDAHSLVRIEALPAALADDLVCGRIGIGELIRTSGLETYREILDIGYGEQPLTQGLFEAPQAAHVYRTYRILLEHTPVILVTEYFRLETFGADGQDAPNSA